MTKLADRFVLEREVGSGGMARVFLGRDEVLDRPVAVKVLKPTHGETDIGVRFRREGRTAARLAHPNIVQVYDAGEAELDGREASYIVMEYLSGGDLKELIDAKGKLTGPELARIGEEVCSGLAHAHGRGVVHRDIKPHNILLDDHGRTKVSDFGIARALDTTQATRTGAYLGTALYSSPEQLQGHKVTPGSDIYSLGVTMYQAATGEPLFTGTPIEIASQHVSKPPEPPSERDPDLDLGGDLEALILACLAKNADDRPSAEQAGSRFGEAIPIAAPETDQEPEPAPAAPPPPPRRPEPTVASSGGRTERRRRFPGLLAAAALLAVLLVIGLLAIPQLRSGGGDAAQNDPSQANQARGGGGSDGGGSNGGDGGEGGNGGQDAQAVAEPTTTDATGAAASEPAGDGDSGGGQQDQTEQGGQEEPNGLTEEAAARTVEDFYSSAASGNYRQSTRQLSAGWREDVFPTRAVFTSTFDTLQSVTFVEGPSVEVSGGTATVVGVTEAEHAGKIDENDGTWRLVNSSGGWKIDGWTVNLIDSRPA